MEREQGRAGRLASGPVSALGFPSSVGPGGPWFSLPTQHPYSDALKSEGLPLGHPGPSSEVHRVRGKLQPGLLFPWQQQ